MHRLGKYCGNESHGPWYSPSDLGRCDTPMWRKNSWPQNGLTMPRHPGRETHPVRGRPERRAARARDREIARLAIPAFAALVSEPLFLLADAAIIGHLGTAPLAGLAVAGTVIQTAIGVFIFLAYGTTSQVARQWGAGDLRAALTLGVDGVWLALLLGAIVGSVLALGARPLVELFGVSAPVADQATAYLQVAAFGIPALLVTFAATGVVRGLQDTRTPLVVTVAANIVNIGLNLLFVYGLDWGIAGSAAGTLLAQTAGAAALTTVVVRAARPHQARLRPHLGGVRAAWRGGLPLMVRTLTLRAAILLTTLVAASISTIALAAHQVAFTLWGFLAFALDALAIAGQAITGRLLGASDGVGAKEATRRMVWWGVIAGAVLGLLLLASRHLLAPVFTDDPAVRAQLATALLVAALHQPVAGVVFVLDGVLIGAGDGRYLAWAGLVGFAVFAPLALAVMVFGGGLAALWWAFTAFMLVRLATLVWRERSDRWLVLGAAIR